MFAWFYPPTVGGVEFLAKKSAEYIKMSGCNITVIIAFDSNLSELHKHDIDGILLREDIHNTSMRCGDNNRDKIVDLVKNTDFDIVYTHNLLLPLLPDLSVTILDICKEFKLPIVEHAHTRPRPSPIYNAL